MASKQDEEPLGSKDLGQRHIYGADYEPCVSKIAMNLGFAFEEIIELKRLYQDKPLPVTLPKKKAQPEKEEPSK